MIMHPLYYMHHNMIIDTKNGIRRNDSIRPDTNYPEHTNNAQRACRPKVYNTCMIIRSTQAHPGAISYHHRGASAGVPGDSQYVRFIAILESIVNTV